MDSQVLVALALSSVGGLNTSLGLMLSISFLDLAHNAMNSIGFLKGNLRFFAGVIFFVFLAYFIPELKLAPGLDQLRCNYGFRIGLNLALAIALHNIPEAKIDTWVFRIFGFWGVAVALPIYFATQSKWQAFKLATLSGLADPLGITIVAYLFPSCASPEILDSLLGSVGGVMAFLTFHEMIPLAFCNAGQKLAVKAVFLRMAFMSEKL